MNKGTEKTQKTKRKEADTSPMTLVIPLNVMVLDNPIKRQRLSDWTLKMSSTSMTSVGKTLQTERHKEF